MATGICIYVDQHCGERESFAELLTAARNIAEVTGEEISALVIGHKVSKLLEELQEYGLDSIQVCDLEQDPMLRDDAGAKIIAAMLEKIQPSTVLIPATPNGRSLFSRVAIQLGCGLTADCTELSVEKREGGSFYIRQNKPSFGDNVYVTIVMQEGIYPQMMTIRPGVFTKAEKCDGKNTVCSFPELSLPESGIKILHVEEKPVVNDSITAAERIVVCGKGMEEEDRLALVKRFAEQIGAALACTRPLSDIGVLPFERQVGQTGATIRPKLCVSIGVSGAIQHTEGIKDVEQYIAINTDPDAAIFRVADFGIVADAKELLSEFIEKYDE